MNLAHRAINNAIFNSLSWVLPLVLNLVFTPYIVHKLGTHAYGILTLVWTIIGYFALLDLGLGNAVIKYVAEYNAEGNPEKTNEVIGATVFIFSILGLIGGIVILSIAKLLVTKFLKIPPELVPIGYFVFCLGSLGFFLTMFLSVFSAIPNGLNRYDITSIVTVMMGTSTILGTVLLLYLGFGLIRIVVLNISISFVAIIAYSFIAKHLLPTIHFKPVLKLSVIKKVMKFGLFSLLSRLSYLINYRADRLVTGAILGISWVTYYVVPFMIVHRITMITVRIATVIFPAISELQGRRRYDTIADLYLTSSRVVLAVATSICIPLLVFGGRLLTLWMGQDFGEKAGLVIFLITMGLYLSAFTNIPAFVVDGLGKPKISGIAAMATALLNLALVVPFAKFMGINGVATAFLISNLCATPIFIWYVNNKVVGISLRKLLKEAYTKPLLTGLLILILLVFFPQDRIDNLFMLMGMALMSTAAYFALSALIGVFPRSERRLLFGYFRTVLKKT